ERDLAALAESEQEPLLDSLLRELAVFDVERDPPGRALLVRLGAARHALLVAISALCADSASLELIVEQIARLYAGDRELAPALQYIDVAEWQNQALAEGGAEAARALWRRLDVGVGGGRAALPAGERRAEQRQPFAPATLSVPLAVDLPARLGPRGGADFLLACWQVLLSRLLGRREMVLGLTCDGRGYEELREVVGPLAKVLPLAAEVDEESSFAALLERVGDSAAELYGQQEHVAWEQLERPPGEGGRDVPSLPSAFEREEQPAVQRAGDVSFALARREAALERFRFKLAGGRRGGRLGAELHYDSGAVARPEAERLAARLAALAGSAAERPEAPLRELASLAAAERQQVLCELNDTSRPWPDRCLHELVAEQAARTPGRQAVVCGDAALSYAELMRRAGALARRLRRLGVGAEVPVGVYLERSLEMPVALLGVLLAGGAYLPLDPDLPAARLALLVEQARPPVVLAAERGAAGLEDAASGAQVVLLEREAATAAPASDAPANDAPPAAAALPDSPAYVIYTSGSSGRPKGVVISHRGIVNRLRWMLAAWPLGAGDRVLQKTPFSFDASVWELFAPLLAGAAVVMARPGRHGDAAYLASEVARQRVTVLQLVPTMLRVLLDEPELARRGPLRRVYCGGEALPGELAERFFARVEAELHILYGPTETSIDIAAWRCRAGEEAALVRLGRPIANTRIYLLDPWMRPVPPGL
ncbi:MAG: AMP-binding protein, partial [Acidobacteria bacterium]|nr:AMP-binding protein [Acidobacteriota bacterium]